MTRILFFGRLRDVARESEREIDLPQHVATAADLRAWLAEKDAVLGEALAARGIHIVVDRVVRTGNVSVRGAKEIAFMPPLSGG